MNAKHLDRSLARRTGALAALAALTLLLAGLGAPAAHGACANEAIRAEQGAEVTALPDCLALEMVSPPHKGGQAANFPAISANGERVLFYSLAGLAGTPGVLAVTGDPYVASRDASGWTTSPTSPPAPIARLWQTNIGLSPDFTRWFQIGSTAPQLPLGISRVYQGALGSPHSPISPLLVPSEASLPASGGSADAIAGHSQLQGSSADQSHLYFVPGQSEAAYLPGDPEPVGGEHPDPNVYIAQLGPGGEPSLQLMARDSSGKAWGGNCGARLGGIGQEDAIGGGIGSHNQGALSADGGRAYFSTHPSQPETGDCDPAANKLRILVREETEAGPQIEELFSPECSRVAPPCDTTDGDDLYQGASVDGTRVYFTTTRQLASSDLDTGTECSREIGASQGCDLYLYDSTLPAGERLVQVSAGGADDASPGEGAGVLSAITAISTDGSHVYFAAQGVLTTDPNPEGDTPIAGQPNLYLYERDAAHPNGRTAFVGTLDPGDGKGGLWGNAGASYNAAYPVPAKGQDSEGTEVGGDGHVLLFQSKAELTADDSDGAHADIFRYDAASESLERVSKSSPGGADDGAFDAEHGGNNLSLGADFLEQSRWAGEDGETAVFSTAEGLLPGDENGALDSYLWRGGQLFRLPGAPYTGLNGGGRPALSADGSQVAYATPSQLLPQDGDTAADVYLLRAGGGFPNPPVQKVCAGEECQGPAAPPPGAPGAASSTFSGPGNLKPKPAPRCAKGRHRVSRHGKARCVKPRKHKRHSKRANPARDASANRRAAK